MKTDVSGFWRYLSNFWNYLDDRSRELWEFAWEGFTFVANEMSKQAARFLESSSPESSPTSPTIDFYDVAVDILKARPTNIDLTQYQGRFILISRGIVKSNPVGSGRDTVYNDMVEIAEIDYNSIRNIAIGQYLVIDDSVNKKYFKVINTKGPSETGDRYFDRYVIELDGADLSYITADKKASVYLTTGKVYKVGDDVIDIPFLSTKISDDEGRVYQKNVDYTFSDGYIEFLSDVIGDGLIESGTILYCKNTPVIETNLFNSFGALVDIRSWKTYGYDNVSAKVAINSLLRGLQNPSNMEEYERCLNVYYGLPIAPERSEVVGMFESYDYVVTAINGSWVTLRLTTFSTLHNFIQPGTKFIIDGTETTVNVVYNINESAVMNRVTGEVLLNSVSGISVGTILNMKLANKLTITSVKKPMYGQSYFVCAHYTDGGEFNHISNYVSTNFPGKYPEIFVYDAKTVKEVVDGEAVYFNDDAYYHFRSCVRNSSGYIKFTVDDLINSSVEEPRYNDFVDLDPDTEIPIPVGRLHIPWPTHKYLLLKFADGTLYKCYLDSPIDSLFATGDIVEKYQVLGRCVNVANNNVFEDWNEFSGFSRSNGIDKESNMLELVYSIPFAKYGVYFPN